MWRSGRTDWKFDKESNSWKMLKSPSALALETASQAWCKINTSNKVMDSALCYEFALIIEEIWNKPWLGNATTGELLEEIKTRCEIEGTLDYKTVE